MQKQKLILIGGGGHCKACIDVIENTGKYDIIGIIDQPHLIGNYVLGYPVIDADQNIKEYIKEDIQFLITIGQIKSTSSRLHLFNLLQSYKANLATIVSPNAYVSKHASIASGTIVMHKATINSGTKIGANCILNTGCNIEHDSIIGNHTHISTHAIVNGNCKIGNEVFIGSNATVGNQVEITNEVIIGMGSLVLNNITEKGIFIGSPATKLSI